MSSQLPSIAYLIGRYPTASETFVYRELALLLEQDATVCAWTLERPTGPEHGILPAGWVARVPRARWCLRRARVPADLRETWREVGGSAKDLERAAWLARRWVRDRVEVVHAHFLGRAAGVAAAACRMAGLPLVVTAHARGIHVPTRMGLWALRSAARVITIAEDGAMACRERAGVESTLLPVAIEPREETPVDDRPELHLLTVARPAPKKGYGVLREAVAGLGTPWRWTVAGAEAGEIGGSMPGLDALGVVSAPVVDELYERGVDVFALPCRVAEDGDRDGVPVALMEAMARGVPVVSSPVGGVPGLIEDGHTGLLVPPDDVDALRGALRRLADDPALRRKLGRAGREHVRYTREPMARGSALLELLRKTAGAVNPR